MSDVDDEVLQLFNDVTNRVTKSLHETMQTLWRDWTNLRMDRSTMMSNIRKIYNIEQEFHRDIKAESAEKVKALEQHIEKLKIEMEELSKYLSIDITIVENKDDILANYRDALEEQIKGYREQVEKRRAVIDRLLEWQGDLVDKLGVTMQELQDVPLPSQTELDKFQEHLEVLQTERDKRVEIFLTAQREIKDIMENLQIKPSSKFEHVVANSLSVDFKVTDHNMDRLAKLRQDFQRKYEETNNRVLELRERLTRLWECLDEDHLYRENFLQANQGCHKHAEDKLIEEIKRCEQIKRQKIQVFVANMRTKIKLMWDKLMYSQEEREEFMPYFKDYFTEDALTLHELYLDKITKFYNDHKNIYDLVATRKELWMKMAELEGRATEPGRYHNRGGQLLKEEKERKNIASNLPKIEAQIKELVLEYQQRTNSVFTVDGKPLLELIQEEWETKKLERHNKLSARKQAMTPSNPSQRSLAVSPLGKRNRTAAGLPTPHDKRPTKRQLITGSANKLTVASTSNLSALRRTAVTSVKKRVSGRLAARAIGTDLLQAKRKLDYGVKKTPKSNKVTVTSNILKHKRSSQGKRRSSSRRSTMTPRSSSEKVDQSSSPQEPKDPLVESTMLTDYTDFEEAINKKQVSRSSMAIGNSTKNKAPVIKYYPPIENGTRDSPKNDRLLRTPKLGKENIHLKVTVATPNGDVATPKTTRSTAKMGEFATPRTPLSTQKANRQRQYTDTNLAVKCPSPVVRSKTHTIITRAKDLPPLI